MAIYQEVTDRDIFYTKVTASFTNGEKKIFTNNGRPNVSLDNGELMIGGTIVSSYVKDFEWNVYRKSKNQ